ncbi:hypothetical protein QQ045_002349 [Rhodiola kirilowii]
MQQFGFGLHNWRAHCLCCATSLVEVSDKYVGSTVSWQQDDVHLFAKLNQEVSTLSLRRDTNKLRLSKMLWERRIELLTKNFKVAIVFTSLLEKLRLASDVQRCCCNGSKST